METLKIGDRITFPHRWEEWTKPNYWGKTSGFVSSVAPDCCDVPATVAGFKHSVINGDMVVVDFDERHGWNAKQLAVPLAGIIYEKIAV